MGLGLNELIVILVIVLILFGPKKLPDLARGMGEAVKEFKKGQKDLEENLNENMISDEKKSSVEKAEAKKESDSTEKN